MGYATRIVDGFESAMLQMQTNLSTENSSYLFTMSYIPLSVHSHKGHYKGEYGDHHPKNLLDGKSDTFYESADGTIKDDWIVFAMEKAHVPTSLKLEGVGHDGGVKDFSVWVGNAVTGNWIKCHDGTLRAKKQRGLQEFALLAPNSES